MNINNYEFPLEVPLFKESDIFAYNFMIMPILANDEKNKNAVTYAMENDLPLLIATYRNETDLYDAGVIGSVMKKILLPDGSIKILFQGLASVRITSITQDENKDLALCESIKIKSYDREKVNHILSILKDQLSLFTKTSNSIPYDLLKSLLDTEDPTRTSDLVASYLKLDNNTAYDLFIQEDIEVKLIKIIEILKKETKSFEIKKNLEEQIYSKIEKTNKEYFLKEQKKQIDKELGVDESQSDEIEKYEKNLKRISKYISSYAKKEIQKQIKQYSKIYQDASSETHTLQTYLDVVFDIPFDKFAKKKPSISNLEKTLNKEHYGLQKPKDKIVEYFCAKEFLLKKNKKDTHLKSNIICFVGPPGVGKTSLANSIANSLGRKLIRIAIGGMNDISELRGHRRTYVGAMVGQIVQGLIDAKEMNPVVVLDEIDKTSSSSKGALSSALLEVLDPQQNDSFRDYYVNFGIDLSNVIFITTANNAGHIPHALRDRMEFIHLHSYTFVEKLKIAQKYLLPQEVKKHSLEKSEFSISTSALKIIIEKYTRESGVRNLRRALQNVIRKSIRKILVDGNKVEITHKNIASYFDKEVFEYDVIEPKDSVGIVNGLAWTSVGGEILKIETRKTIGKGIIYRTGNLGDIMKESSQISFSVVKEFIDNGYFDIDIKSIPIFAQEKRDIKLAPSDIYKRYDIHLHIPEGSTPKDGPSAGGAMAVALASILCNKKVKKNIAMTGELTLSGKITPIGGLKEKLIAAYKGKVKTVLIPKKNYQRDLIDIPDEVLKALNIISVDDIKEVFNHSFV